MREARPLASLLPPRAALVVLCVSPWFALPSASREAKCPSRRRSSKARRGAILARDPSRSVVPLMCAAGVVLSGTEEDNGVGWIRVAARPTLAALLALARSALLGSHETASRGHRCREREGESRRSRPDQRDPNSDASAIPLPDAPPLPTAVVLLLRWAFVRLRPPPLRSPAMLVLVRTLRSSVALPELDLPPPAATADRAPRDPIATRTELKRVAMAVGCTRAAGRMRSRGGDGGTATNTSSCPLLISVLSGSTKLMKRLMR